jgi:hypothetical protein
VTGVVCGARHGSEYVSDAIADIEIIDRRMAVRKVNKRTQVERIRRPIGGRALTR